MECLPFSYLGIPLGGNYKKKFWDPVIDKIRKKIDKWKNLTLLKRGRLTLAQSVLTSIPLYYFSVLKTPVGVVKEIGKLILNFFWNGGSLKGSCNHLVNWGKTSLPLQYGGLGIGALKQKNNSLLLKWPWRFTQEKDELWRKVIVIIYGEASHGWSTLPSKGRAKGRPCFDIFKNNAFFFKFLEFEVTKGARIKYWHDIWLGTPSQHNFPVFFNLSTKKDATIAECWNKVENDRNLGLRRGLFDWKIDSWVELISVIDVVRLGEGEDRVVGKGGNFSTRSACLKMADCTPSVKSSLLSAIWKFTSPKKVKVFLWSPAHRSLNTHEILQKKCNISMLFTSVCKLYMSNAETIGHLFVNCPLAVRGWNYLPDLFGVLVCLPNQVDGWPSEVLQ